MHTPIQQHESQGEMLRESRPRESQTRWLSCVATAQTLPQLIWNCQSSERSTTSASVCEITWTNISIKVFQLCSF